MFRKFGGQTDGRKVTGLSVETKWPLLKKVRKIDGGVTLQPLIFRYGRTPQSKLCLGNKHLFGVSRSGHLFDYGYPSELGETML